MAFTTAQVAAYLRDQNITDPAAQHAAAQMFGVTPQQLTEAQTLLRGSDKSAMDAVSNQYKADIAANPQQGVLNDAWVAQQSVAKPWDRLAELNRINDVRNPDSGTNNFTPEQIAAYLRDQQVAPADYTKTANMFGVNQHDLTGATNLMAFNDPGIQQASDAYKTAIAADPRQGALNDAWVAAQAARNPVQQQAELDRINTMRNSVVNPAVNPIVAGTSTYNPTAKPAPLPTPSGLPNTFQTPVLDALYAQQRQNMTSTAPTFNFQQKMQAGGSVGALHRAIRGY